MTDSKVASADWLENFKQAAALHTSGQLEAARLAYLKLVTVQPPSVHLLKLLGILELDAGQAALAQRWLELAYGLNAECDTAMLLAKGHLQQDNYPLAKQWLHTALELEPESPKALFQLGLTCKRAGELDAALAFFSRVLAQDAGHAQAWSEQAYLQLKAGQSHAARTSYDRYLALCPGDAVALYNRGMALHAEECYAEAAESYRQAIALDPQFAAAYNNLATTLGKLGAHDDALAAHLRSMELAPQEANYPYNMGLVLFELGRFDDAAQAYARALDLRPSFADAAFNRGNALREGLRLREAIASFDLALALQPDNANTHWTQALALLLQGDYQRGWQHYERRWLRDGGEKKRSLPVPQWTGSEDIRGKTLLIHPEQGLGDLIQFSRYALNVVERGARVVFGAPPTLHALLRSMHPGIVPIVDNSQHPDFDFHCPVMSLPAAFATRVETIPAPCPYYYSDDTLLAQWAARLGPRTSPRIGLVWFGNPKHLHDHRRSMALQALDAILQLPFEFHSLQQEVRPQDSAALAQHPQLQTHHADLTDLSQAAALIAHMDLVLSVDTALAHLAGALGKPVWVLVHAVPDFRWLLDRADSPWYPRTRVYRQQRRDSWSEVLDTVRQDLLQEFASP